MQAPLSSFVETSIELIMAVQYVWGDWLVETSIFFPYSLAWSMRFYSPLICYRTSLRSSFLRWYIMSPYDIWEKQPHTMKLRPPYFTVAMVFSGSYAQPFFLHDETENYYQKSLIFVPGLVWSVRLCLRASFVAEVFSTRCRNGDDCSAVHCSLCSCCSCCFQVVLQLLSSDCGLLSDPDH